MVLYYFAKFGRFASNVLNVITEIHRKSLTPCVPSFKVTQGHWNPHGSIGCTYEFQVNSNYGPISYRFGNKRRFRSNSQFFPTRAFNAHVERVPLEIL